MRPLRIALGDLSYINDANETNQNVGWQNNLYVPLNIGYLSSYTKRKFGRDVGVTLFKDPTAMLEYIREIKPDLIGLSAYYWNAELTKLIVQKTRGISNYSPIIVMGGPSVDSDQTEQALYKARNPGVDYVIPNEGEEGFASVVSEMLSGSEISISMGLKTDLDDVPSPYLDGTLDPFLTGPFQPMVQTSRLCPYTCSFCVSGKNRGKLRAFDLDQVREELIYIGKRFNDRKDHVLHIVDENFGILDRDREVAKFVKQTSDAYDYPRQIFFYNDKRFTQIARDVHEITNGMVYHGVTLSLQSENPETLKAIKRRNLTDVQVMSAVSWAHDLGLKTSTELIFGLPMETRASFKALLDKCAKLGFDSILCYNLIIFDGIEMNRKAYREQHSLETKRRLMHGNSSWVDNTLCVESEEVVISSNTFNFDDYKFFRAMNALFHAIFINGLHKEFFKQLVVRGESLTDFLEKFLEPSTDSDCAAQAHRDWLSEFDAAMQSELYNDNSLGNLILDVKVGKKELPVEIKLQPIFARKLSDHEHGWVKTIIDRIYNEVRNTQTIAA